MSFLQHCTHTFLHLIRNGAAHRHANHTAPGSLSSLAVLWEKIEKHRSFLAEDGYPRFRRLSGAALIVQQAKALFAKRWHSTKRQYFLPILAVVIPVVLFILFAFLDIQDKNLSDSTSARLVYDLGPYSGSTKGFLNTNGSAELAFSFYEPTMKEQDVAVTRNVGDADDYLLKFARESLALYEEDNMVSAEVLGAEKVVVWYNGEPLHIGAMSLNLAHNALLRFVTGDVKAKVSVTNHPLPGRLTDQLFMGIVSSTFHHFLCALLSSGRCEFGQHLVAALLCGGHVYVAERAKFHMKIRLLTRSAFYPFPRGGKGCERRKYGKTKH